MSDTGIKQAETLNTNPSPIVTIQTESDSGYFSEDTSESSLSESPRIYTEDGVLGSPKKGKSEESSQSSSVEEGDPTTKKKKKKTLFKNMFWRSNDTLPQLLEEVKVSKDVKEEPRRIRGFEKIKGLYFKHCVHVVKFGRLFVGCFSTRELWYSECTNIAPLCGPRQQTKES